jgi:hypothetical protein
MKDQTNMTLKKTCLATSLALAMFTALPGCSGGDSDDKKATAAVAGPGAGSYVYVQFRRDFLGLASPTAVGPTTEGMGASGTLKEINREFVVLKVDNEAGRELWIPRESVLMMDVRPTQ